MARARLTLTAAALAGAALLVSAGPAGACPRDPRDDPATWEYEGVYDCTKATFGHGVNVTLGLPFVRTSVDHGTALDLAGSGRADTGSMAAALRMAAALVR